ncbi:MAG: hypothetical protein SFY56_02750 [Bacteroidota bacterium]|nr:hypothetical protein [Bacteroidota bacterium]
MKKIVLHIFLITLCVNYTQAQDTSHIKKGYKYNNHFDLALAGTGKHFLAALSWVHLHPITKKQRFKIGYGVRFNNYYGNNLNYVTAPAKLTSKRTDPGVLFSEIFYENIDTFFVSNSQQNSLNLSINLQFTIKQKFDVGFNIDAIGVSFGSKTTGTYKSYQAPADNNTLQTASPTPFNLLLVSDNDIGSLNSELYFRYWFKPRLAIKAGASFFFSEYTTVNKLRLDNNRWRNKSLMPLLAITYSPFR